MDKPYYFAYEDRYQKVFAAGAKRWGHSPDDALLYKTLSKWVEENKLAGKRIIEFGCGEGAAGEILSELGCIYHGVDISPTGADKARKALERYGSATVSVLDMVNQRAKGKYDAALDVMALHMLVLDNDREKYLSNAFRCLACGAPMLFFRESHRKTAYEGRVNAFDEWLSITGDDYLTPQKRTAKSADGEIEVSIPLVPARAKTELGYKTEMENAGFIVTAFAEMDINRQCPYSASVYVRKP